MIDVKELKILNRKDCSCNKYKFSLKDVKGIEKLVDAHGFYANLVKHYSKVVCPECHNETILLLKQMGQTWEIMNTATIKKEQGTKKGKNAPYNSKDANVQLTEHAESKNKEENNSGNEFICPECKKVCKNKSGLIAHMRTHKNSL